MKKLPIPNKTITMSEEFTLVVDIPIFTNRSKRLAKLTEDALKAMKFKFKKSINR